MPDEAEVYSGSFQSDIFSFISPSGNISLTLSFFSASHSSYFFTYLNDALNSIQNDEKKNGWFASVEDRYRKRLNSLLLEFDKISRK